MQPIVAGAYHFNADHHDENANGRLCTVDTPRSDVFLRRRENEARPGAVNLNCLKFIGDGEQLAYRRAAESDVARDRLANILIDRSNAICQSELALLMQNQAEVGGWLGIATTGLAAASTVVTGDLAKSILSGGAAFTSGSTDQISSFAYKDTLIEVINTAIREKRALALETIVSKFGRTTAQYSVDHMIRDVNQYHQLCSFEAGLSLVVTAVGKADALQRERNNLRIPMVLAQMQGQLANAEGDERQAILTQMEALRTAWIEAQTGVSLPVEPVQQDN